MLENFYILLKTIIFEISFLSELFLVSVNYADKEKIFLVFHLGRMLRAFHFLFTSNLIQNVTWISVSELAQILSNSLH